MSRGRQRNENRRAEWSGEGYCRQSRREDYGSTQELRINTGEAGGQSSSWSPSLGEANDVLDSTREKSQRKQRTI